MGRAKSLAAERFFRYNISVMRRRGGKSRQRNLMLLSERTSDFIGADILSPRVLWEIPTVLV